MYVVFLLCSVLQIVSLDLRTFSLECVGRGDIFDRTRHASGTEIKAITYSAMDIKHDGTKCADDDEKKDEQKAREGSGTADDAGTDSQGGAHVYVIVDI